MEQYSVDQCAVRVACGRVYYHTAFFVDDNKIHAKLQANMRQNTGGKKSRFQQKYEELMRQQEELQRQKQQGKSKRK